MSSIFHNVPKFKLQKSHRLCKKKEISRLYELGTSIKSPAIILLYHTTAGAPNVKALFSAPKKKYKRAHDRNRIKRLFREAYRKNYLPILSLAHNKQIEISLALIFTGKTLPNQDYIVNKTQSLLHELLLSLEK